MIHPHIEEIRRLLDSAKREPAHSPTEDALIDAVEMLLEIVAPTNVPRSSQNQTASSGVEGAHEGTTADKSEPEKLNNAQGSAAEFVDYAIDMVEGDSSKGAIVATLKAAKAALAESSLRQKCAICGDKKCICDEYGHRNPHNSESSLSSPPPDPQLVIACLEEAIELFELDDDVNTPGTDSWLWKVKAEQALIAYAEAEASPTFRQSSSPMNPGPESVHSGKQNTADKSELLPTQLPKEK